MAINSLLRAPAIRKFVQQVKQKGVVFAVRALLWKVQTALFKRLILTQDRFGWFPYSRWIRENENIVSKITSSSMETRFSFVVQAEFPPGPGWKDTLVSLQSQQNAHWEVYILFISSNPAEERVDDFESDPRIHCLCYPTMPALDHILQAGEWVGMLQVGDTLAPGALRAFDVFIAQHPEAEIIYTDQDRLSMDGKTRYSPCFWPDWSPELLLSTNFLSRSIVRRTIFTEQAQAGLGFAEIVLHCTEKSGRQIGHIPQVLYHIRPSTKEKPTFPPEILIAHLERSGISHVSCQVRQGGQVQFVWQPEEELVSIIILSCDRANFLKRCIESILKLTDYPHFEILVIENNSKDAETFRYYEKIRDDPRIRIVEHQQTFNYSEFNNFGASHARGSLLLFLNNDTEVVESGWLAELVRWAQRSEIGMVGAKLLYPNGLIQHAGIVVGLEGHAQHIFAGLNEGYSGIYGSEGWYRNYSAVTGACMLVRKSVFNQIGGFDPNYQIAFGDVELCLRVRNAGLRVVYTPFARLVHHEGMTRANYIPAKDIQYSVGHFQNLVNRGDPFYNPNLSGAVRVPTLRRRSEELPLARFNHIVEYLS